MKHRTPSQAMAVVSAATEQVIQDGGVVHEDALWDANEMALDGANKESMIERLESACAEPYEPKGRSVVR